QFPPCLDLYARGQYEPALLLSKRFSMPSPPGLQLLRASIAGKIGRADEARAALRDVGKISAAFLQIGAARVYWSRFVWDDALADDILDGYEKALALGGNVETPAERPPRPRRELRVAVLPFTAKTPGAETASLADGLTDDVTAG